MNKRGGQLSENYTTYGWNPDKRFIHGWCDTCQVRFTPQPWATKQYYCQKCRSGFVAVDCGSEFLRAARENDLVLKAGFLNKFLLHGEGLKAMTERLKLGVKANTVHQWNKTGRVPSRSGSVDRLCRALKMSKTELQQRFGK